MVTISQTGDISIFFSKWGRHHLGLKFPNFTGQKGQENQTVSPYQISWQSVKPLPKYGDFSIFPRWRLSAILDMWCTCLHHPQRAFGDLYHVLICCNVIVNYNDDNSFSWSLSTFFIESVAILQSWIIVAVSFVIFSDQLVIFCAILILVPRVDNCSTLPLTNVRQSM